MSNKSNEVRGRGRPRKELVYPKGRFTVNDLVELNPQIKCRLSLYTRCDELVKQKVLRYTGETIKTGGVGKPLFEFQTMAAYRNARNRKRNNKLRKLENVSVDLTPAPVLATA
jgi:hypothetical protein